MTVAVTVLLLALGFGLAPWLNQLETLPAAELVELRAAFFVALLGTGLVLFSHSLVAVTQGLQSGPANAVIYNGSLLASLALTLILLKNDFGLLALAYPIVLRGGLYSLGNALYLNRRFRREGIRLTVRRGGVQKILRPTSFTALTRLAGALLVNLENVLLARWVGLGVLPVYALSRKGPDLVRLFIERGVVASGPALACSSEQTRQLALLRVVHPLIAALALLAGGAWLFNEAFMRCWVGSTFFLGASLNGWLMGYVVLQAAFNSLLSLGNSLGDFQKPSLVHLGYALLHAGCIALGIWQGGLAGMLVGAVGASVLGVGSLVVVLGSSVCFSKNQRRELGRNALCQGMLAAGLTLLFSVVLPSILNWLALIAWAGAFAGSFLAGNVLFLEKARRGLRRLFVVEKPVSVP
ncbi:MAG: hypothetical protein H7Y12_00495 [Sphingobacteriaceae bacterium]|nr:hypothetical protein [Cytophagaceae bacterium]